MRNEVFRDGVCLSAEVIDLDAGTISFEELGVIKSTRALTADEVTRYAPSVPVKSPDEKLTEARTVLEQIASLPAPVLTADVVDLLDDLRGVL